MTNLRISQLATINVVGGTTVAAGLRFSQLFAVMVGNNPAAAGLRFSQLFTIAVTNNGRTVAPLGPPIGLGCWTPCGVLIWNHNGSNT